MLPYDPWHLPRIGVTDADAPNIETHSLLPCLGATVLKPLWPLYPFRLQSPPAIITLASSSVLNGPGRRKISLGRPRPLFRLPMKPVGPMGLTGVNRAKNKRNFGCVWPPVTTKAPRPTDAALSSNHCGSSDQMCLFYDESVYFAL